MNKHLHYILIGTGMGILGPIILLSIMSRWGLSYFPIISLLAGGIPGSIGGWIGGAIIKNKWGAVVGGLLFSIFGILFAGMPT